MTKSNRIEIKRNENNSLVSWCECMWTVHCTYLFNVAEDFVWSQYYRIVLCVCGRTNKMITFLCISSTGIAWNPIAETKEENKYIENEEWVASSTLIIPPFEYS